MKLTAYDVMQMYEMNAKRGIDSNSISLENSTRKQISLHKINYIYGFAFIPKALTFLRSQAKSRPRLDSDSYFKLNTSA